MADNDYLDENPTSATSSINAHGVDAVKANPKVASSAENAGIHVSQHDKDVVDYSRAVLAAEAEGMDGTDGPADNFSGAQSHDLSDHLTLDPFKKAFPPGPADPTKLKAVPDPE